MKCFLDLAINSENMAAMFSLLMAQPVGRQRFEIYFPVKSVEIS